MVVLSDLNMQKYQQLELLGKFSQDESKLYLVKNNEKNTYHMAKKIYLFGTSGSEQLLIKQAKMLQELKHPHIIKYYQIFLDAQHDELIEILEFCEYGDLLHYAQKKRNKKQLFSEKLIISWVMQILMALEYIHQKNIIHRLITPENIYLNHQGDLKLGSFWAAKLLENTIQKATTIVGQPCNMSPQIVQGNPYDTKTDIWSLGCLIYHLTTFQPPFKFGNLMKLYDSIVKHSCPELPVKYSKYLSPLYKKMMKKNPTQRPSASQLLQQEVFVKLMKEYLKKKKIDSLDLKRIAPKPLAIHRLADKQKNRKTLTPINMSKKSDSPILQKQQILQKSKTEPRQASRDRKKSKSPPPQKIERKKSESECQPQVEQRKKITKSNEEQGEYISKLCRLKLEILQQKYSPMMSKIFQQTTQFDQMDWN